MAGLNAAYDKFMDNNKFGKLIGGSEGAFGSKSAGLGAIGSGAGDIVGGAVADGFTAPGGEAFQAVGDIASNIPGPGGAVISFGVKSIGGAYNRVFGNKMNQEHINAVNNNVKEINSFQSNAGDFDSLSANIASAPAVKGFDKDYIGSDGPLAFSNKAKNTYKDLKNQQIGAMQGVQRTIDNNAENILDKNQRNMLANMIALGGPLHTNGMDLSNGITQINNGGTHEENPFQGVPIGVDNQGIPNLVEQGEVIWDDYVFSNRLKVPTSFKDAYGKGMKGKKTYAEMAKYLQKELEERPNDPITKRGVDENLSILRDSQEELKQKKEMNAMKRQMKKYKDGGLLANKFDGTSTLSSNLNTPGITKHYNFSPFNIEGTVLDSTTPSPKYPSTTPLQTSPTKDEWLRKNTGNPASVWGWYGENNMPKVGNDSDVDPVTTAYGYNPLANDNENVSNYLDQRIDPSDKIPENALSDPKYTAGTLKEDGSKDTSNKDKTSYSWERPLRYAPVVGSLRSMIDDWTGKTNNPDYVHANRIEGTAQGIRDVKNTPVGQYLSYNPLDRDRYINQLNASAGATRRMLANSANGNRGALAAQLLAADYNANNQIGAMDLQAQQYNDAQKAKVQEFNRGTDSINSQMSLQAQSANQHAAGMRANIISQAENMKEQMDNAAAMGRAANRSNFYTNLGNIGQEAMYRDMINNDKSKLYTTSSKYKGGDYTPENIYAGLIDYINNLGKKDNGSSTESSNSSKTKK